MLFSNGNAESLIHLFILLMALWAVGAGSTGPTNHQDWDSCNASEPEQVIQGCTTIVQAGQESNQRLSEALHNRGMAYKRENRLDNAIGDFNQALRLSPDYAEVYYQRALVYGHRGEYNQALQDYNQLVHLNSKFAQGFYGRGWVYMHMGDYDRAKPDLDQALVLNPRYVDAFCARGSWYAHKN